jgi:hypothetical protein
MAVWMPPAGTKPRFDVQIRVHALNSPTHLQPRRTESHQPQTRHKTKRALLCLSAPRPPQAPPPRWWRRRTSAPPASPGWSPAGGAPTWQGPPWPPSPCPCCCWSGARTGGCWSSTGGRRRAWRVSERGRWLVGLVGWLRGLVGGLVGGWVGKGLSRLGDEKRWGGQLTLGPNEKR